MEPLKSLNLRVVFNTYYLLVKFKQLQSGFLRQVSCTDGAIHACSIKAGPGILHNGMPCLIVVHYVTCSSSVRVGLPP